MSPPNSQLPARGPHITQAKYYELLKQALQCQLASQVSAGEIVTEVIRVFLPPTQFEENAFMFFNVACAVSQDVPYNHEWMDKLAEILEVFFKPESFQHMASLGVNTDELEEIYYGRISDWYDLIQDMKSRKYANVSSFLARLEARGVPNHRFHPNGASLGLYGCFRDQFEGTHDSRQGRVMAAAQWIRFIGRELFDYFLHPERYPTVRQDRYSLRIWQGYRLGFQAFANGDRDGPRFTYSDECKNLASDASAEMLRLEREAGVKDLAAGAAT